MQESQHLEFKRQWYPECSGGLGPCQSCNDTDQSLPDKWNLDKLMAKHASSPFNPDIANAFFRAGLIESWGRGIERIMEDCRQKNYPAPEWEIELGRILVTFRHAETHIDPLVGRGLSVGGEGGGANVGANEVFGFIQENQPVNASTIAGQFPQVTKRTIERWIKELRDQGLIEFKGAAKTGGYFVIEG